MTEKSAWTLAAALSWFSLAIGPAAAGEIFVQESNGDKVFRLKVKHPDRVSKAELGRIESFIRGRGYEVPWRHQGIPELDFYFDCPHKDGFWMPCPEYDRATYVSCVAEFQKQSVSGLATYEAREDCYNQSRNRGFFDFGG